MNPCILSEIYISVFLIVYLSGSEWDPWGIPEDYECEVIENDAPVPRHVPLHRPGPLPEEFYKTLENVTTGTLEDITIKKKDPSIA